MALGFLKSLFAPKGPARVPDLAGPLDLRPGDRVVYYRESFVVAGIVTLADADRPVHQYHLRGGDGDGAVLAVAGGDEPSLSLQRPLAPEMRIEASPAEVVHDGAVLRRARDGRVETLVAGDLPPEKSGPVSFVEYEDDEEIRVLVAETWGDRLEVRAGEIVNESELDLHRAGEEERFEIRPPPRIDRRALIAARRAREHGEEPVPEDAAPVPPAGDETAAEAADDDAAQPSMS